MRNRGKLVGAAPAAARGLGPAVRARDQLPARLPGPAAPQARARSVASAAPDHRARDRLPVRGLRSFPGGSRPNDLRRRGAPGGGARRIPARRAHAGARPGRVPGDRDGGGVRRTRLPLAQRLRARADHRDRRPEPDPVRGRAGHADRRAAPGDVARALARADRDDPDGDLHRPRRVVAVRLQPLQAMLIGSIVAGTDGAAIFAVLRGSTLKRRLARTLEGEAA